MAVPADPNAEGLANLIQAQGQGQEQPLVQDQQLQAQEQQTLSQLEHTSKLLLGSNTLPNYSLSRTHKGERGDNTE